MKFRTAYEPHDRFISESGDGFELEFKREYDPGTKRYKLVCTGKTDVYGLIQTAAEGVDLKSLLARYINGDEGALGTDIGSYADLTTAPKTLLEAHLKVIDARNKFDALPVDVRKEFNNNFDEFLSSVGSGDFSKLLGEKVEKLTKKDVPPVSEKQMTYIKEQLNNVKS